MRFKEFLETKHITMEKFKTLEAWKQEEWRRQHQEANREEQIMRSFANRTNDNIEYDNAMSILHDCGVPFGPDGPLGIGWDD